MSYKILEKKDLVHQVHLMKVIAPDVAKAAKPGQFVIVRIDEQSERIPLTIADYDLNEGSVTIIFQEMGKTTKQMAAMHKDQQLLDFVGPLGTPSDIKKLGTVILVGGGVGIAPIYPQAKAYRDIGNKVISIIGARSEDYLILEKELSSVSDELFICTDDGTKGYHGFVTQILQKLLEERDSISRVVAIGPAVMMRAAADVTKPFGIETIVSLNPIMIDGTGMCGGCRVSVGGNTKFACVDGPEFDAHKVDFSLLLNRLNVYKDEELSSLENHECTCRGR